MFNNQGDVYVEPRCSRLCTSTNIPNRNMLPKTSPVGSRRLACQPCRERHVKCNGSTPCSRCTLDAVQCIYTKPNQGRSETQLEANVPISQPLIDRWREADVPSSVTVGLTQGRSSEPLAASLGSYFTMPTTTASFNHADYFTQQWDQSLMSIYSPSEPMAKLPSVHPNLLSLQSEQIDISTQLDTYFHFFHPTHPILFPRKEFQDCLAKALIPHHLECAIIFNCSFFIQNTATGIYGDSLDNLFNEYTIRNAYTVQAMLLFGIGMHANNFHHEAARCLRLASDLAINLGMHRKEFAINHGEGNQIVEESWRRTWWEIYVLDGLLAGICPLHHFDLYGMESDVPLPCEESEYNSGKIPRPCSLVNFDNAMFEDEKSGFSSFAYRIDAVRNLGKILQTQNSSLRDEIQLDQADAILVNWAFNLPNTKREFISRDGQIDEMLLQAHLIINVCTIILHSPYSDLILPNRELTTCSPYLRPGKSQPSNRHTAYTLHAAASISAQVRHLADIRYHSHFLTSIVALVTLVHLSNWIALGLDDDAARQSVRLDIGVLNMFAKVWPIANVVLSQVKATALAIAKRTEYSVNMQPSGNTISTLESDGSVAQLDVE
ncbi:hypothetical protein F5884DRAFT_769917 [Xylogone sp. PMI_703]|nr:hypothetical protein F5884DRAFT_769917 [Xylogone sp. PMI_703]